MGPELAAKRQEVAELKAKAVADGLRIAELEAENRRLLQELDERTRATERVEDEKTKQGLLQQIVTETALPNLFLSSAYRNRFGVCSARSPETRWCDKIAGHPTASIVLACGGNGI